MRGGPTPKSGKSRLNLPWHQFGGEKKSSKRRAHDLKIIIYIKIPPPMRVVTHYYCFFFFPVKFSLFFYKEIEKILILNF
jgi:hypothetical protein